jgi:hypothetical protein
MHAKYLGSNYRNIFLERRRNLVWSVVWRSRADKEKYLLDSTWGPRRLPPGFFLSPAQATHAGPHALESLILSAWNQNLPPSVACVPPIKAFLLVGFTSLYIPFQ